MLPMGDKMIGSTTSSRILSPWMMLPPIFPVPLGDDLLASIEIENFCRISGSMVALSSFQGLLWVTCSPLLSWGFDIKTTAGTRAPLAHSQDTCDGPRQDAFVQRSRRKFFGDSTQLVSGVAFWALLPDESTAAAPVTAKETDSLGALARRSLRPKPPKLLRRKLSQDFAVLLMRSSYNALDQLDCVAMDQFQRDFFLIRRSEYEPYTKALGPGMVQQGDLTDPYYFDFISYAQYETINREISQNPPFVFEEQQPVDQGEDKPLKFVPVVIKRDPSLTNDKLGPEHGRIVGAAILDRLEEIFGQTDSAIPKIAPNSRPGIEVISGAIRQLVNLFLVNGYAMGGSVSMSDTNRIIVTLSSPATLWGGKILQSEGAKLNNDFLLKASIELVRRAGYYLASSAVKYDGTSEEITITLT